MGALAGFASEPMNQYLAVAMIFEVLGMPTPTMKILASGTDSIGKNNVKIQQFAFTAAVVFFGDHKV